MNSYLCANGHHFTSPSPRCPRVGCTAEIRPTAQSPLGGSVPDFKHLPRLAGAPAPASSPASDGTKHAIRWWAVFASERVRRTSTMKDNDYVWDATCSCGWDSRTGGATMGHVDQLVQEHKRG